MRKIQAIIVLVLLSISMIPLTLAESHIPSFGSSAGIHVEINKTEDSGNDDTHTTETSDQQDSNDNGASDDTLLQYAQSHIKEKDVDGCERRLQDAYPDATRGQISHTCVDYIDSINLQNNQTPSVVITSNTNGLNRCVGFLQGVNIDNVREICLELLKKELQCVPYFTQQNIPAPEQKCDALFAGASDARVPIGAVAGFRMDRIERIADSEEKARFDGLPPVAQTVLVHLPIAQQKKILDSENPAEKLKRYTLKLLSPVDAYRKRIVAQDQMEKAQEAYQKAKERYQQASDQYDQKRDEFLAIKKQAKECGGLPTEECQKINQEVIDRAKEFLLNAADKAIEYLNKIKQKAQSSDDLSDEDAAKITQEISDAIAQLEDAKSQVNAATTKEEITQLVKTINEIWRDTKQQAILNSERVVHAKIGEIIQRSTHLEDKLHCSISALPGGNNVEIDAMVSDFSSSLASAQDSYEQAKDLLNDSQIDEAKAEQAKGLLQDSQANLQKAHDQLKNIVNAITAAGGQITSCPDDTNNEVAVVESE